MTPLTRLRQKYDRVAACYDLLDLPFERFRYRRLRRELVRNVEPPVLEVGVGTGQNLLYYPDGLRVVGIDLSLRMLERARRRADSRGLCTHLAQMDATALAFSSGRFMTIVATFVFCVLPDRLHRLVLDELTRVCHPAGRIILIEYEYSRRWWRRIPMRLLAPYVEWLYGARFDRETARAIREAGVVVREDRYLSADVIRLFVLAPPR